MATGADREAPYRRRRWIANASFQLRLAGALVLSVCTLAAVILLAIYLSLWVVLWTFDLQHDQVTVLLFRNVGLLATVVILFCALIGIWAFFWITTLSTHKIAGPLVRIMMAVEQMSHGNFNVSLALRKGDGLHDLAENVNRLAAYLRSRIPPAPGG